MRAALIFILFTAGAQAAPVVEYGQTNPTDRSVEGRLHFLEQQAASQAQLNLPGRIQELQQDVESLRGQLEVQENRLQKMAEEHRAFYEDLDSRLNQLSKANNKGMTDLTEATALLAPENSLSRSDDTQDYQIAYHYVENKQFGEAVIALQRFVNDHPKSSLVPNAHYWLGEVYAHQGENRQASQQFSLLVSQYPQNPKVPDALFKMAIIEEQQGEREQARQGYEALLNQYPGTTAARLARTRLQQINKVTAT